MEVHIINRIKGGVVEFLLSNLPTISRGINVIPGDIL